ncbi:hypothetical protein ACFY20_08820 [Streptomyces sp. NPDC001312]|uniref:hypothetical protein n=1 Tax=Streptomyces sp. NPDC001312 TaxID=3364561 RepID=UPI0036B7FEEB
MAEGSNAPTEAVAKALGYSRPTAARDIRAARERGLLPATAAMAAGSDDTPKSQLPEEAGAGRPVWRSFEDPQQWEPLDEWVANAGEDVRHPGVPTADPSDPRHRIVPESPEVTASGDNGADSDASRQER